MINPGTLELHYVEPAETGTLLVTGVAKSGTSLVAAALDAFGVDMGESWAPGVFEDREFDWQFKYFPYDVPLRLIEERNERRLVWGFKQPALYDGLRPEQLRAFRNPRMIVTTRDFTAVLRRHMLGGEDARHLISELCRQHMSLMAFVQEAVCPVLMLSYEKFLAFPENSLRQLSAFCGLHALPRDIVRVADAVVGENADYLKTFRAEAVLT